MIISLNEEKYANFFNILAHLSNYMHAHDLFIVSFVLLYPHFALELTFRVVTFFSSPTYPNNVCIFYVFYVPSSLQFVGAYSTAYCFVVLYKLGFFKRHYVYMIRVSAASQLIWAV